MQYKRMTTAHGPSATCLSVLDPSSQQTQPVVCQCLHCSSLIANLTVGTPYRPDECIHLWRMHDACPADWRLSCLNLNPTAPSQNNAASINIVTAANMDASGCTSSAVRQEDRKFGPFLEEERTELSVLIPGPAVFFVSRRADGGVVGGDLMKLG